MRSPEGAEGSQEAPPRPPPSAATPLGRGGPQHVYLQELIKRWAQAQEWRATIEEPVLDGQGSVDVALEKGDVRIACEVSVSSSPERELANIRKCLAAGFDHVVVVSKDTRKLQKARKHVSAHLEGKTAEQVHFLSPDELFPFLEEREAEAATSEDTVRGYKVKTRYRAVDPEKKEAARKTIAEIIAKGLKKLGGGKGDA